MFLIRLILSSKSSDSSSFRIMKCSGPILPRFLASSLKVYLSWPKFIYSKFWRRWLYFFERVELTLGLATTRDEMVPSNGENSISESSPIRAGISPLSMETSSPQSDCPGSFPNSIWSSFLKISGERPLYSIFACSDRSRIFISCSLIIK